MNAEQKQQLRDKEFNDFKAYLQNTRNEFVEAVNKLDWDSDFRVKCENLLLAYDQTKERLNRAHCLPIQEKSDAIEWVSVKDRLPDVGIKVQVYCNPNSKFKNPLGVTDGVYWGESFKGVHNGWSLTDITHWMPLPNQPIQI